MLKFRMRGKYYKSLAVVARLLRKKVKKQVTQVIRFRGQGFTVGPQTSEPARGGQAVNP